MLFDILLQTRGILNHAGLVVGRSSTIDVSHHYGLERFREFGCVIVNCINRVYCKKLIVVLPRQKHPYHYHKIKEESFQLLWGDLEVEIDGARRKLEVGDIVLVEPGRWHKFHSLDGAVFEEVSTTHLNDDSFYEDEQIALRPRESRKTELPNWEAALAEGRFLG
jgi:D-lyxose ketol-isomerase